MKRVCLLLSVVYQFLFCLEILVSYVVYLHRFDNPCMLSLLGQSGRPSSDRPKF